MTREEAIEELKAIKSEYSNKAFGDSRLMRSEIEVLDVAIKALEQEPCEVSEYDSDHIWYKGGQYISLRRFLEVKAEQEPCGDLISREAVIDAIDKWVKNMGVIALPKREGTPLLERIHKLPSVNPQPKTVRGLHLSQKYKDWQFIQEQKTGHWIDTEFMKLKECSICHERWGIYSIEQFDFCPSCGARMVEPQERKDKE